MIEQAVGEPFARQHNLMVGLGELLEVVVAGQQRIVVVLHQTMLEQLQDDARVFRVVLVPGVEQRIPIARPRHRRDGDHGEPLSEQSVGQGAVEVARRLEGDPGGPGQTAQEYDQTVIVLDMIGHPELLPLPVAPLDQHRVEGLPNVNRDEPRL